MSTHDDDNDDTIHQPQQRKLRCMVITMGGARQAAIEAMFASPALQEEFEPPTFSPGVSSRALRSSFEFFRALAQADLLPEREWKALQDAMTQHKANPQKLLECLRDVPIEFDHAGDDEATTTTTSKRRQRRGSPADLQIHYSVEMWRKGKGLNRGRSVLACLLAHLIALKKFTEPTSYDNDNNPTPPFDVLLEDNVRCPLTVNGVAETARRIRRGFQAAAILHNGNNGRPKCHLLYFGWLGSTLNLEWVYKSHIPRHGNAATTQQPTVVYMPTHIDIEQDLETHKEEAGGLPYQSELANNKGNDNASTTAPSSPLDHHTKPGGSAPIWGAYAYWMSREAYLELMDILRHDVGAMLFKHKKARHYSVKPIDKVLPRQIMLAFGQDAVQLTTHPAFFRAPMLTSKIHTIYDPEFCKSTDYQLRQIDLSWSELWLTTVERKVVDYSQNNNGEWLTPQEPNESKEEQVNEEKKP